MTTTYQVVETKQDILNRLSIVQTSLNIVRKIQSLSLIENEEAYEDLDDLCTRKRLLEVKLSKMN